MREFKNITEAKRILKPYIYTLIIADFGVYKLMGLSLDENKEICLELLSKSGNIVRVSQYAHTSILKGKVDNYSELEMYWNTTHS